MLEVGEPAPTFDLRDQNDETATLEAYSGQWVVLYFFPRADTPGCTTEACGFRDNWDEYERRDVTVLGVSDDPVDDLASFADKYDLPFRLLSDPDGAVATKYDSYGEKQMFGRTFDGVYRNTYLIDSEGHIAATYPDVDPEGHAATILADLDVAAEE